jgi:hypothetical protein
MRLQRSRILSLALLATYAGISLLGQGLHELVPHEGHHHHGIYVVERDHDSCEHHCYHGHHRSAHPIVTADDAHIHSHLCEICQFLAQAIGQPVEVAAPIHWQPLATFVSAEPQPLYVPASLGPQAPRGPPIVLS